MLAAAPVVGGSPRVHATTGADFRLFRGCRMVFETGIVGWLRGTATDIDARNLAIIGGRLAVNGRTSDNPS